VFCVSVGLAMANFGAYLFFCQIRFDSMNEFDKLTFSDVACIRPTLLGFDVRCFGHSAHLLAPFIESQGRPVKVSGSSVANLAPA